jgi:hypothetical protein
MSQRSLRAILVVLTWATGMAHACTCAHPVSNVDGCDRSWTSDGTVFLGTVSAKTQVEEPWASRGTAIVLSRYAVRFSAVEMFHGSPANGEELVVYTGMGGGDCGYPFAIGTRYLVYASTWNGHLGTGICNPTSPEVIASGAIKELRALRDTGRADDLFGIVSAVPRGVRFEDLIDAHPLAGVAIRLIGSRGEVFSTTTDTHGVYSFSTLPSGSYRVEHDLPFGLVSARNSTERVSVELSGQDGRGAGCGVNVSALPDGVISGAVVDGNGEGLAGFVTIEPIDPAEAKFFLQHGGLSGDDTNDGKFTLPRLPPGRYRLIFHPRGANGVVDFYHKFYWPKRNEKGSDAIEVVLGQHVENIRFEVVLP